MKASCCPEDGQPLSSVFPLKISHFPPNLYVSKMIEETEGQCELHGKPAEFVCIDDEAAPACADCALFGPHKNHDVQKKDQFLARRKENIERLLAQINEIDTDDYSPTPASIRSHLRLRAEIIFAEIASAFYALRAEVNSHEAEILENTRRRFDTLESQLSLLDARATGASAVRKSLERRLQAAAVSGSDGPALDVAACRAEAAAIRAETAAVARDADTARLAGALRLSGQLRLARPGDMPSLLGPDGEDSGSEASLEAKFRSTGGSARVGRTVEGSGRKSVRSLVREMGPIVPAQSLRKMALTSGLSRLGEEGNMKLTPQGSQRKMPSLTPTDENSKLINQLGLPRPRALQLDDVSFNSTKSLVNNSRRGSCLPFATPNASDRDRKDKSVCRNKENVVKKVGEKDREVQRNKEYPVFNGSGRQVGDLGIGGLINEIMRDKTVKLAILDGNQLSNSGLLELLQKLSTHPSLERLSLRDNRLSEDAADIFERMMPRMKRLSHFVVSDNKFVKNPAKLRWAAEELKKKGILLEII